MESNVERDTSTIDSIFYNILNDIKNAAPIWEDFVLKSNKLHSSLRLTIQSMAAYLEVFQKIADTATNSKVYNQIPRKDDLFGKAAHLFHVLCYKLLGASKEIGTVLTRVCLRQKSVKSKLKLFTASIMNTMIIPLQNQLDEWHRDILLMERNYAKDQKRSRADLKKHSTDTIRLKKKTKKCQSDMIQSLIETSMVTITNKHDALASLERAYVRDIVIEERNRFCVFVNMLQPVVKEGCNIMCELGHLQEAMDSISNVTQNPKSIPVNLENTIFLCGSENQSITQITSAIGSRKNSGSSLNSCVSNDSKENQTLQTHKSWQNSSTMLNKSSWMHSDTLNPSGSRDPIPTNTSLSSDCKTFDGVKSMARLSGPSVLQRPPLPIRCSSLDRAVPKFDCKPSAVNANQPKSEQMNADHSFDRHTYVNTMDMNLVANSKPCVNSSFMSNTSIVANGFQPNCDSISTRSKEDVSVKEVGSIVAKLSIFERIQLLNNDAISVSNSISAESRSTEQATQLGDTSNEDISQHRNSIKRRPEPPVRRSSSVTPSTSSAFQTHRKTVDDTIKSPNSSESSSGKSSFNTSDFIDKPSFFSSPKTSRRHFRVDKSKQASNPENLISYNASHHHPSTIRHLSSFRNNISDTRHPSLLPEAAENTTTARRTEVQSRFESQPLVSYTKSKEIIYATPNDLQSNVRISYGGVVSRTGVQLPTLHPEVHTIESDLSRKAVAVRTLINRQALPDPRLCHESLMNQIKMGAHLNSQHKS